MPPGLVSVRGAALDFLAGRAERAPHWMRAAGWSGCIG